MSERIFAQHKDGASISWLPSIFKGVLSEEAQHFWMTQTPRDPDDAKRELAELAKQPDHPQYHLIKELIVWKTKQRILK